jgi:putative tryptophan/tyrosine transport system substrate-binding protein
MTTRRKTLGMLGAVIASASLTVRGQQSHAIPRVAYLHPGSAEGSAVYKALIPGLADLGYVDGRNITLELRSGNGKPEAIPALVAELVRLNPAVLLVVGPAAVKAAIAATRSTPIVAIDLESDPVKNGWMKSLSRPGGNVTGFFLDLTGMSAKWLQLLHEAVPDARRISLLWDATSGGAQLAATKAAASAFSVEVQTIPIMNWGDFDSAVAGALQARTQAFVVLSSPTAFQYSARFAEFTNRNRIPAISPFRPYATSGGLMSYGPDLDLFFRRTAFTIDRVLKGAKAGELAAEQPNKYELVINMKTATLLGLTIPQSQLLRADEVIQ